MSDWRIGPRPGHRPRRDGDDGGVAVPLTVTRDGQVVGAADLVLTAAEAEQLHAALCYALDGRPVPDFAPDCRYPVQRRNGAFR
ncbi:hypothetical protein IHE55_11345 [Streptomyces pactum]|uniref:Uncharacterized protein n=1 Tax=Streptomyces pactum TaxID=68249 RepID=A0ABS0NJM5_9ACTN|nr:hypothetical protein [Streptomyces pactum]MBH5335356.1 hypothetical protein [Streptomyces pactum]